jgi:hypothetical protein
MRNALKVTTIALAAMMAASQAHAVTLTTVFNNYFVGASGAEVIVPQAPDALAPAVTTLSGTITSPALGSLTNTYRSPWQYTKSAGGTLYEPIGKFTSLQAGSVGEVITGARDTLSLAWGSPDTYNTIEFWLAGVHKLGFDVTGADLFPPDTAALTAAGVNFVSLFVLGGFDKIILRTTQQAFEIANLHAPGRNDDIPDIPLPAGLVLLLSGLTGLGVIGRRRAKAA